MPTSLTLQFENTSLAPLRGWTVCTVPTALSAELPEECTVFVPGGRQFRAVRGARHGRRTVYRVFAALAGGEVCEGTMVGNPTPPPPFAPHRWAVDDPQKLAPRLRIRTLDGLQTAVVNASGAPVIDLVDSSPAHKRFRMRANYHGAGCWLTWFVDLLHNDPVLHVWGVVTHSDRTSSAPARTIDAIEFRTGEAVVWDGAKFRGFGHPVGGPDTGFASLLLSKPVTFQDGAGFGFSGRMLTFRDGGPAWGPEDDEALAQVRAAAAGRIYAVCLNWAGHWLASGEVPALPSEFEQEHAAEDLNAFLHGATFVPGITNTLGYGCGPDPSGTGEQEDFGATKGSFALLMGRPAMVALYQFAAYAELLRGRDHFTAAGERIRAEERPDWVTWSGVTHYSAPVSPDRLNKSSTAAPTGTGFIPHDDQHMSMNNVAAALALCDDPVLDYIVEGFAECERASYAVRFNSPDRSWRPPDADAARAQGRTVQALAQLASVAAAPARRLLDFCRGVRLAASQRTPTTKVPGPMKALAFGAPDNRKAVFLPNGERAPWVSCWEHGLAMVGFSVGCRDVATPLPRLVATFLAEWAIHQTPNGWVVLDDIAWHGGEVPPGGVLRASPAAAVVRPLKPNMDEPTIGGTAAWTIAGLVAARPFLAGALAEKVDAFLAQLAQISPAGDAPGRMRAEWWATPRVAP